MESKVCYICMRVDGKQFFKDLKNLGFSNEQAVEISSWVKEIYEKNPPFLCGKSAKAIKSTLAYIASVLFRNRHTQRDISEYFGLKSHRIYYAKYIKTLLFCDLISEEKMKFKISEEGLITTIS